MLHLLRFTNFLKERQYALEDLGQFAELIEPVTHPDGWRGYKMRSLTKADRIAQRCQVLIQYTWHCRDYVKKILTDHGLAGDPGQVVNRYIAACREIQVISYLANEYKHGSIDASQKWGVDIAPRIGKPFVLGVLEKFPHRMKPVIMMRGDSLPGFEITGAAGIGDETFQFTEFEWLFSCDIEDKDGKPIGNARGMCEIAFQNWLKVLSDNGIAV